MKATDLAIAVLAIKDLEIKTLKERIAQLEGAVRYVTKENDSLYAQIDVLQEKKDKEHHVGFKGTKE